MKNSVSEYDVISLIRDQKKPMSIDGIASSLGVFRHLINPVMRDMLNNGSLVRQEENGTPMFTLSDTALVEGDQAIEAAGHQKMSAVANNVTPIAKSRPKAKAEGPKLTAVSNKATKQPEAKNSGADSAKPNLKLLKLLLKPKALVSIKEVMGEVEQELESLKLEGIVDSDYILDEFVYYLTDKARQIYPELTEPAQKSPEAKKAPAIKEQAPKASSENADIEDKMMAEAMRQLAKSSPKTMIKESKKTLSADDVMTMASAEPAIEPVSKVERATETAATLGAEVPETPAKLDAEVKTVTDAAPEPVKATPDRVGMAADTMSEVALLVEKLVNQRLESHASSRLDDKTKEGLSTMLKEASDNLKQAAKALDNSLTLIGKL